MEAETVRGVRVTVMGTCQVKVDAFSQENLEQNLPQITLACQHFLGKVCSAAAAAGEWMDLPETASTCRKQLQHVVTLQGLAETALMFIYSSGLYRFSPVGIPDGFCRTLSQRNS